MKHVSMDREDVNEYVERCKQLIEASPQMNEQNTKVRLVQPFLELLGWDLYSTEVELEYTIPMASRNTHVDYTLLVADTPAVFVEAKPVRADLTESNVQQLKSYMRQELDVDWGILTNGKVFEVLTKSPQRNGGEEVSVIQFNLDDLTENPDVLELLSKESIRSGRADEVAEQVAQTNEAIYHLQENENQVTASVTESVENKVGDIPIDLEEHSREFVQNLVTVLREQRHFVSEEHRTKPKNPEIDSPDDPRGYAIRFSDGQEIPELDGEVHSTQKENMGAAVDYLIQECGLIDGIELPYSPPHSRKNCSINSDPIHPSGDEMRAPYQLVDGNYLHTSLNTRGKKNRIQDIVEQVGQSVEFVGEW